MTATRTLTFTFDNEVAAQAFDRAVKSSSGDLPYGVRYPAHDETITDEHVDMVLAIEYFAARAVNAWLPIVAPMVARHG